VPNSKSWNATLLMLHTARILGTEQRVLDLQLTVVEFASA
jgi:hypothetical protein